MAEITVPPALVCPPSWFACDSGECIEESKVCDFTSHCSHGEDEAGCRKTLLPTNTYKSCLNV